MTTCGNRVVDAGEECDDGGESATCDVDCTFAQCGDDVLNVTAGEECDDGTGSSLPRGKCYQCEHTLI